MIGSESEIRKEILQKRQRLTQEEVQCLSQKVIEQFIEQFTEFQESMRSQKNVLSGLHVAFYSPLPKEVQVHPLERVGANLKWKFFFPRVSDQEKRILEFFEVKELSRAETEWQVGPYGIYEPKAMGQPVDPQKLDLILVPGVVFGENGQRIGMGKGYYDRYLAQTTHPLRVSLAFDFQVFPTLDQKPTDQPVHWILTEKRSIQTPYVSHWLQRR